MGDLVSGRFRRPAVYVVIVAAAALALAQLASFSLGSLAYSLTLSNEDLMGILAGETSTSFYIGAVSLAVWVMVGTVISSVFVGSYVAHRVPNRPLPWAVVSALLSVSSFYVVGSFAADDWTVDLLTYSLLAVAVLGLWLGVRRGARTQALFRAMRLFKRLSEPDRQAVLNLMDEGIATASSDA